jgi:GDP/UDP-N,N'-diacetylbacillosamine 2-epimerase (hydrolysing)
MKLLVATSSRADFGLLLPVIRELKDDAFFQVEVCEIGSHISGHPENFQALKNAGFTKLSLSVEPLQNDSVNAKVIFASAAISALTSHFSESPTDAVLLLGDRYETLAVAYAATLSSIPVIHLVGGDLTLGSIDDSYRHAITKLARIHFVTNTDSYNRVLQLGEDPEFVCVTGSPVLDALDDYEFSTQFELETLLGLQFKSQLILVTFHPDTINPDQIVGQVSSVIDALENFVQNSTIILTAANHDSGHETINKMFQDFASKHPSSVKFVESLGTRNYLSMMRIASMMVGNSSSGYYEAPSFGLPVVDLGNRQKGRIAHDLLINSPIESTVIILSMTRMMNQKRTKVKNPYWDGSSSVKMREFLKNVAVDKIRSPKKFIDFFVKEAK